MIFVSNDPATDSAHEPSTLRAENYLDFFQTALKEEAVAQRQECEDHALFRVPFAIATGITDPRFVVLVIHHMTYVSICTTTYDLDPAKRSRQNSLNPYIGFVLSCTCCDRDAENWLNTLLVVRPPRT